MPPGAVTLDNCVDYVLEYVLFYNTGEMLELSEAIRDYHDHTGLPQMVCLLLLIFK